ncbi:hypothetical protein DYB28_000828 [Aphanomyces astaci]|uniref:Uncharacterized protein n=1 Tax=Aphanomyces astaci TaxID=112090 RepID=A0A397CNG1_APHAT|nr:hypothetical protein DYB36_005909 [Aphanomyces astaci]RHY22992.1 hypothetical protein DYB25_002917 [Aphanomyces astaci]RHY49880.1 hypothetical protein DYB30_003488 [Aphanomyces astaci]RHY55600.1 hypothetical protein DYB34_005370 [Aphanomyces astaci]RHY79044.1 hypothetical protein DYB38_003568 [Aphanomyces astaci]
MYNIIRSYINMEFFGCEGYGRGNEAARSLFEGAVILTVRLQHTTDVDVKLVGHLYSKHVPPMAGSSAFATQSRRIQWTSTEKSTLLNEAFLHQFQPLAASNDPEVDQAHGLWDTVRGAGVAPKLIDACNSRAIPALALLLHCAEGNNVPDAVFFASCVVQYLSLHTIIQSFRLVLPPSWAQLYGRDPAIALYA